MWVNALNTIEISLLLVNFGNSFCHEISGNVSGTSIALYYHTHETNCHCYRHFFRRCSTGENKENCLDDFKGVVHYNDSGCIASIVTCSCATYHKEEEEIEIGKCLFNCAGRNLRNLDSNSYTILPLNLIEWNAVFCGQFNRSGTLCGKCQSGLYAQAYSFDLSCVECTNVPWNWLKYFVIAYLPLTVFCIFILISKSILPYNLLNGFVLHFQLISTPTILRQELIFTKGQPFLYSAPQIILTFYGIWNLDFFRTFNLGICLETDPLATLALDLAIAMYPLVFILLTSITIQLYEANCMLLVLIWKPFKYIISKNLCNQNHIKASTVDCFSTFILLSSVKLLNACFDILIPTELITLTAQGNITRSWRVYYDPSITYFSHQHLPYLAIVIIALLINIVAPTFLLLLYPFKICQSFLNKFSHRWQLVIRTFVDSFQGCYKDGTQFSKVDFRSFSVMPFIMRIIFFCIYGSTINSSFIPLATTVCVLFCMLYILVNPLKAQYLNIHQTNVYALLFLALYGACISGHTVTYGSRVLFFSNIFIALAAFVTFLPVLYLIFLLTVEFLTKLCKCFKFITKFCNINVQS